MFTSFTFITLKCNTCNKTTTFEPGIYTEIKSDCKCNEKIKPKPKRRTKVVKNEK